MTYSFSVEGVEILRINQNQDNEEHLWRVCLSSNLLNNLKPDRMPLKSPLRGKRRQRRTFNLYSPNKPDEVFCLMGGCESIRLYLWLEILFLFHLWVAYRVALKENSDCLFLPTSWFDWCPRRDSNARHTDYWCDYLAVSSLSPDFYHNFITPAHYRMKHAIP